MTKMSGVLVLLFSAVLCVSAFDFKCDACVAALDLAASLANSSSIGSIVAEFDRACAKLFPDNSTRSYKVRG